MNDIEKNEMPINNFKKPMHWTIISLIIIIAVLVVGGIIYYVISSKSTKNNSGVDLTKNVPTTSNGQKIPMQSNTNPIDASLPMPENFNVENSNNNSLIVSWDSAGGAYSYELARAIVPENIQSDSDVKFSTIYSGNATSYTDTGLTQNAYYSYEVRTVGSTKNSKWLVYSFPVQVLDHVIPTIDSLSATIPKQTDINTYGPTTVTWQTKGAANCIIDEYRGNGNHNTTKVDSSGSKIYTNNNNELALYYMILCYDDEKNLPDTITNLFSKKYGNGTSTMGDSPIDHDLGTVLNTDNRYNHYDYKTAFVSIQSK